MTATGRCSLHFLFTSGLWESGAGAGCKINLILNITDDPFQKESPHFRKTRKSEVILLNENQHQENRFERRIFVLNVGFLSGPAAAY